MKTMLLTAVCGLALTASALAQDVTLRASHQWPGGKGDVRDEMVQMIGKEVEAANVGLKVQVFPNGSLFKPRDQWGAVTKGQVDITAFPLDYASGRHPEYSATLMPGLVGNHDRAQRLNDSPFMDEIKKSIDEAGALVLSDAWLAGGFVSSKTCITSPESAKGQTLRAAGPAFEQMLVGAGASISSMPSSEIYTGMQQNVLQGANTSSGSLVSYRIYEVSTCLTAPGENALWFMYEPILMSKRSFEKLNKEQQDALMAAGEKAEAYFAEEASKLDAELIEVYKKNGVEVTEMTKENYDAWLAIAKETSYKEFAEKVPNGQALIDAALAVE
ncbi:MAG: ABC transporter substrate-binding protein [Aurantimonas sp.]|mgnify:CR=1 FL=1|jgi:TRAP-type transport system periplasmic protein|uniref:Extracellular solute-binding protein n=1 Tax=Aurantimonas coralicida TaxID=182270 RepID=A0A0P0YZX9_9HYPH|nr:MULTISPECIES: TRAP transporter substrate-binding protein DctP [Aurantimonas]MAY30907.1 ABC transporter substrate-binding protein [Aurantimonas sp.]MBC6714969.1 TRAP transporter substrate-binding protein DctP [Aurantimonas sp. DM33-3]MCC4299191.1 TRAP transporter substrate-binding protein DctP [Aurantimonas coralicida]MCD1642419.1 TRAP transporter substrate-binding protein DctP [Aurantimonas coralicida]MDE0925129.1 TRAP transporter substrate-binding protein DctP [Aurantimonas coralicida]|tara:strand:+ start:228 stop:1217 length:990 start_codon:yes stop_codon:yes gene_type:complete